MMSPLYLAIWLWKHYCHGATYILYMMTSLNGDALRIVGQFLLIKTLMPCDAIWRHNKLVTFSSVYGFVAWPPFRVNNSPSIHHIWTINPSTLQWRRNDHDGVSIHEPHGSLFRRRSKKTSKLYVTGLCVENSPVTGEFPAQRASNAENVSIWWRHHETWHMHTNHKHANWLYNTRLVTQAVRIFLREQNQL